MNDPAAWATLAVVGVAWLALEGWELLVTNRKTPLEFGDSVRDGRLHRYGEARLMKIYGEDQDDLLEKPMEFGLMLRDIVRGTREPQTFTAIRAMSKLQAGTVLSGETEAVSMPTWIQVLSATLADGEIDGDGDVPYSWKLEPREPSEGDLTALRNRALGSQPSDDELAGWQAPDQVFNAPDGSVQPIAELEQYADPKRWTSRRRFVHFLQSADYQLVGDVDTLRDLTKDLVAASGARPTDGS